MNDRIQALEDALRKIRDDVHLMMTGRTSLLGKIDRTITAALAASHPAPDCHQPDLVTVDGDQAAKPVAWGESYDGGKSFDTVSLNKTRHHTFPLYTAPQPLTVQDAARVPEIAALIEVAMNREHSLIWIIENTSQVRIRDLALDILTRQRDALRAIAGGE